MTQFNHVTVLLHEAVDGLNIKPAGIYVDGTLGGGGHSQAILERLSSEGHLYAFDQDQTAIQYNQEHLKQYIVDGRLTLVKSNFSQLKVALAQAGISAIDGMVYDLGVSSPQFDDAKRGFSHQHDAPLDMRMDQTQSLSAMEVVNEWSFQDLMRILSRYGEEKFAKQIARSIEKQRWNWLKL